MIKHDSHSPFRLGDLSSTMSSLTLIYLPLLLCLSFFTHSFYWSSLSPTPSTSCLSCCVRASLPLPHHAFISRLTPPSFSETCSFLASISSRLGLAKKSLRPHHLTPYSSPFHYYCELSMVRFLVDNFNIFREIYLHYSLYSLYLHGLSYHKYIAKEW